MNLEIRKRLSRIVDLLQADHKTSAIAKIEQVCNLIFLKKIDEDENNREYNASKSVQREHRKGELLFVGQSRRYRWSEWGNRDGKELLNFVRDEVFPYMASLVREEPQVANHFRDAQLEFDDPIVLKKVVDEISFIEFSNMEVDVKSEIVEYLIAHLAEFESSGIYRTPPHIRNFMVEMVDPDFGDTIYDPACGTGGFLIEFAQHILAKYSTKQQEVPIYGRKWFEEQDQSVEEVRKKIPNLQIIRRGSGDQVPNWEELEHSIYGADISRSMIRIAMTNLILHDIERANIKRADSLTEMECSNGENIARKYRVILSNPPFGGLVLEKGSIGKRAPSRSKRLELRFLEGMMDSLAVNGRCAVIVPESLLYGSSIVHVNLRRKLIEDYDVLAVISLPAGVLGSNRGSIKTSVLVFQGVPECANVPDKSKRNKKVWFYEIRADGFDPRKITAGDRHLTPDENDIPDLLAQWKKYKKSGFKKPTGVEGETVLTSGTLEPRCWWATVNSIQENGYNLVAKRYRPQFVEQFSEKDATELIQETLAIERNIATGLEQLLRKVRHG